jgi:murein DD-endopeptidase MepM/ murein hydrolase activator NlpD
VTAGDNVPNRELMTIPNRLVLVAATLLLAGQARGECREDSICVDTISDGGDVELLARNLREFPITYTLRVSSDRRLRLDGPSTVTRTLEPQQSERIMRISGSGVSADGGLRIAYDWTVGDRNALHDDDHLYSLPYAGGKRYRVLQGFGSPFSHTGLEEFAVDFDMPEGTPVHAARAGIVARVEESNSRGCWEDGCGQFANYIVVLHSDGTTGEYYHLDRDGALVTVGDSVVQGQRIGYSGNTGHSTMPHLHFAVYRATDWGNTQSIPVRFRSRDGIIDRPRRGARYEAL